MITTTEIQRPSITLRIAAQSSLNDEAYESALNRLTVILLKFQNWNDELSLSLYEWGAKVLSVDAKQLFTTKEALIENTNEVLQELVKKILINPIDSAPLEHPLLDRKWVWEKWMLEDYQSLLPPGSPCLSPFDKQPIIARTHDFAIEMLAWSKSLMSSSTNDKQEHSELALLSQSLAGTSISPVKKFQEIATLSNTTGMQALKKMKLILYLNMAQKEASIQKEKQRQEQWKGASNQVSVLKNQMEIWQKEHRAQVEQEFKAIESHISSEMAATRNAHQVETSLLKSKVSEQQSTIEELATQNEEQKNTNRVNEEAIRKLRAEIVQNNQEMESLRRRANKKSGFCSIS